MLNKLKYLLNKKFNTKLNVNVLVSEPNALRVSLAKINSAVENNNMIFITPDFGLPNMVVISNYLKINDVYHIESERGKIILRVL